MKIIMKKGKTRADNIQLIIVDKADKYGVAMLAYFNNVLGGQNKQHLAAEANRVKLLHDCKDKIYVLQIKGFNIARDCILSNYKNFRAKYDILIKDKICHFNMKGGDKDATNDARDQKQDTQTLRPGRGRT